MTDQEAAERNWAIQNGLGSRVREMNAGHRHDVINFFYDDANFRRTNEMGMCPESLRPASAKNLTQRIQLPFYNGNSK